MFKIFCFFNSRSDLSVGRSNAAAIIRDVKIRDRTNNGMEIQFTNKTHFQKWVGRMIDLQILFKVEIDSFPTRTTREERNDDLFVGAR